MNISDTGSQLHVSWRSRMLCTQFACKSNGLGQLDCPDFSPFLFVRVRRVATEAVSNRAPAIYIDCP